MILLTKGSRIEFNHLTTDARLILTVTHLDAHGSTLKLDGNLTAFGIVSLAQGTPAPSDGPPSPEAEA